MNCLQTERVGCNEHNVPEEKTASEYDVVYLNYVNEQGLGSCPQVKLVIGWHQHSAVLDTGGGAWNLSEQTVRRTEINPYPTAFPYGNGMVLHFYQQQESSTTKTVHKVINKRLKTYV